MDIINKTDKQRLILAGLLIIIGVVSRILLHDFFNGIANPWDQSEFGAVLDVFFVTAIIAILSGVLLGKYYTIIVPIAVLFASDIFYAIIDPEEAGLALYTSWLFLFTVSGYVFMALLGFYVKKKSKINYTFIPKLFGVGILGIVIYDLWTNFGFWLTYSRLGWYPMNIEGLATVYSGGIPMMIWHILSAGIALTVIAIPLIYFKEHEILKREIVIKPMENYILASATIILVTLIIISTFI